MSCLSSCTNGRRNRLMICEQYPRSITRQLRIDNGDTESSFSNEGFNHSQPPSYEWEIITANFPADTSERLQLPVRVEKVVLSPDYKELIGTIAVANLASNKTVVVRFTLQFWKTTSVVLAEYANDAP